MNPIFDIKDVLLLILIVLLLFILQTLFYT